MDYVVVVVLADGAIYLLIFYGLNGTFKMKSVAPRSMDLLSSGDLL